MANRRWTGLPPLRVRKTHALLLAPLLLPAEVFMPRRCAQLSVLLCAACCLLTLPVFSQEEEKADTPLVKLGMPAGTFRYWADTWGMVGVTLSNRDTQPRTLKSSVYFEENANLQFAREFWIPAMARRRGWCPVKLPATYATGGSGTSNTTTIPIKGMVFDVSAGTERLLPTPAGKQLYSDRLEFGRETRVTGIIEHHITGASTGPAKDSLQVKAIGDSEFDYAYEGAVAMHNFLEGQSANPTRRVQQISDSFLPAFEEGLDGLDRLVICNDRLSKDVAAAMAVRRWVHRGGLLWVMLDRVDERSVSLLLGEAFDFEIVDKVNVARIAIRNTATEQTWQHPKYFEDPLPFVRILASSGRVDHTLNGWPASLLVSAGKGKVLFTTVASEAWIVAGAGPQAENSRAEQQPNHHAGLPLRQLAEEFMDVPRDSLVDAADLKPFLIDQIGYRIVQKNLVVLVLSLFCLSLPIAGIVLWRSGKLEQLVWLGPVFALAATLVLLELGRQHKQGVQPTVAMAQIVEATAGTSELAVSGLLAIYNPDSSTAQLGSAEGGTFIPDLDDQQQTRRMVWTGLNTWHWENVTLPQGIRTAEFQASVSTPQSVEFQASFGPDGVIGKLTGKSPSEINDPLLALPSGSRLTMRIQEDGSWISGPADLLAPDTFTRAELVTDAMNRRKAIYQSLFEQNRGTFPLQPYWVGWTTPYLTGFTFGQKMERTGEALLLVPILWTPTPPGTKVTVPSAFSTCRSVAGPGRTGISSLFRASGPWIESPLESSSWLRFQLPDQVLPLRQVSGTLQLDIKAPGWQIKVSQLAGEKVLPIATKSGTAKYRFEIAADGSWEPDAGGGLTIGIQVVPEVVPADGNLEEQTPWQIQSTGLDIRGTTSP